MNIWDPLLHQLPFMTERGSQENPHGFVGLVVSLHPATRTKYHFFGSSKESEELKGNRLGEWGWRWFFSCVLSFVLDAILQCRIHEPDPHPHQRTLTWISWWQDNITWLCIIQCFFFLNPPSFWIDKGSGLGGFPWINRIGLRSTNCFWLGGGCKLGWQRSHPYPPSSIHPSNLHSPPSLS